MRVDGGFATFQLPPLTPNDVIDVVVAIQHPPSVESTGGRYEFKANDGYRCLDLMFRDGHIFRATVFGDPPAFLILSRIFRKEDPPMNSASTQNP
jgi:hypothetical protein